MGLQLFDSLEPAVEAALRASIRRWGVLVPIFTSAGPWEPGIVIDGHHRDRIAKEEGCGAPAVIALPVKNEEEAVELARTLNVDRRQLDAEQRRQIVADLRSDGHSERAIAGALGVSQPTVHRDIASGDSHESPERIHGRDGKTYPARPPVVDEPEPEVDPEEFAALIAEVEAERLAALPAELAQEVGAGTRTLTDAETIHGVNEARLDVWADNISEALRRLARMAGSPVPQESNLA